jgi:probable HAF family extracellular repeat protein
MYRYTPGVGLQQLDTFGGLESETGRIDASGRITGYSQPPSQINFAFRSTTGTELQNLGSLFGGGSRGYDINSFGWVVGVSDGQNAFLYRDRLGMTLITPGVARGLNDAGMVVGYANLSDGSRQAFAYENGTLRYLTVSGNQNYAFDVNSLGTIVGQVDLQATIWSDASGQQNLNWLIPDGSGWDLLTANAINDAGQITGQGIFNGQIMGYRLDLVPEPAIWVLSPLGLVSFLFSRWYPRSRL